MANDFSADSSCKALYRFESGALTTDSKGTNTLTNQGSVAEDTTNKKEGTCAANFNGTSQYFNIPDANLSAGFPFKSGDTTKLMTVCLWVRRSSVYSSNRLIVGKYGAAGKASWGIELYIGTLRLWNGINSGASSVSYSTSVTLSQDVWYHITVVWDAINKNVIVYIYNDSTAVLTIKTITLTDETYVSDADLTIGASGAPGSYYGGRLDEIVFFNRLLSPIEISKIRAQTYVLTNQIDVAQVLAEVEYLSAAKVKVTQIVAQVEWVPTDPNVHVYTGNVPLNLTPGGLYDPVWAKQGNLGLSLAPGATYLYQPPGEFIYEGAASLHLTPSSVRSVGFVAPPVAIPITITPVAEYLFPDHFYEGGLTVTLTPGATYGVPISGWDKYTGYGCIDAAWLSESPPFWCPTVDGPILILDPTAQQIELYAEYAHKAQGGVIIGGAPIYQFITPTQLQEIGSGGVTISGAGIINFRLPTSIAIIGQGGVRVGGYPTVKFTGEGISEIPVYKHTGRGGVVITGQAVLTYTLPKVLSFIGEGEVKVGAFSFPDVVITRPKAEMLKVSVVGQGGVEVGGEPDLTYTKPRKITITVSEVVLVVGGMPALAVIRPKVIEFMPEGGVVVGEEEAEECCDTWVLTGTNLEPSLYSGFNFNSYAVFQGKSYAAGRDGIYLLEGPDDNGKAIHSGVRIRASNFGDTGPKRLRSIYLGENNDGAEVRVECQGKAGYYLKTRGGYKVGRDLKGGAFIIDVADFEDLSHFEIVPFVMAKR